MILHFFSNDKFLKPYLEFMNANFDETEHYFIVWGGVDFAKIPIDSQKNLLKVKENLNLASIIKIIKLMKKAQKIIIHSMYNRKLIVLLNLFPKSIRKSIWIVWGGDLYQYLDGTLNLKARIFDLFRRRIIHNVRGIGTLVSRDYDLIVRKYKTTADQYNVIYMSDERTKYIKDILNKNNEIKDDITRIIVGNSATESNNHEEILLELSKFSNHKIEVYCPLSYGQIKYGEKIKHIGNELFGKKFIALDELLSMKEYVELLNRMDIGFFNNDRQQGLGNIYSLLYLGKKVYLRDSTTMWDEMTLDMRLKVFSIKSIKHDNFKGLRSIELEDIKNNINILDKRYGPEYAIELWSEVFI